MTEIGDEYGRTFRTLRVSLLSRCNLGCVYCVDGDGSAVPQVQSAAVSQDHLDLPALLQIMQRLQGLLQLTTVRLTGGEPLIYPDLIGLIAGIRSMGIGEIKLTTNGVLLKRLAAPMQQAGMRSINVSLDAIDEELFFRMSRRRSVKRIVEGIDAALEAGLDVKINAVIMRGMNDSQIIPLMEFAASRGIAIRFLELMAMGHLHERYHEYLFPRDEILSVIADRYRFSPLGRKSGATAHYWKTDEGLTFGVIANETEPFCRDCDRLRLDSQGNIFGCLSSNHPIRLDPADSEEAWRKNLRQALLQKQALRFVGSDLSMLHIGG
ncbi:MAG: GTP 3',8-cyclase MoaA [Bacteroidota bacterium]|nr:GTP 3',8-cyclase MoaA [Bacteroidota bacterium]